MLTTTNYKLKKPELTDSPPDITVMNFNWDTIDEKLFAVIQAWEEFKASGGEIGGTITTNETHYKSKSNISYKVEMLDNGFYALNRYINGAFSENVMRFDTNNTNINGHLIPFNTSKCIGLEGASWQDMFVGAHNSSSTGGYNRLPNGYIIQWGDFTTAGINANAEINPQRVFPTAFPSSTLIVIPFVKRCVADNGATLNVEVVIKQVNINSKSAFQVVIKAREYVSGGVVVGYIAIGK